MPRRRAASVGTLKVASGATLTVEGGAPLAVGSFSGGGTVDGDVAFAVGGELVVPIVAGAIAPLTLTGSLTGVATVRVTGNPLTLETGVHTLLTAAAVPEGAWTLVFDTPDARHSYRLRRTATTLLLEVERRGMVINFR